MLLHHVFERRRTAEENDGLWRWLWHGLLEHVLGNEAYASLPVRVFWLHIYSVVKLELLWIVCLECVKFFFKKDIFDCSVAENKGEVGSIVSIQSCLDDLVARSNTSAASNHSYSRFLVKGLCNKELPESLIGKSAFRAFHEHDGTRFKSFKVLGHDTAIRESGVNILSVDFDHEVNITSVGYHTSGSVFPTNKLAFRLLWSWHGC